MRRYAAYFVLLLEVAVFYRRDLFLHYAIPWDLQGFSLPLAHSYADALQQGSLPLWDPYTYCGRPMQANIQTQVFYPPTALAAWLGSVFGHQHLLYLLELDVILHVFLAGVFAYWLGRALGLGLPAALTLATIYQLGGFFAAHAEHMTGVNAAAWLPLAWYGIVRWWQRPAWRHALVVTGALALAILAGFTPVTAVVFASSATLAAVLAFLTRRAWRVVAMTLAAAAGSILLAFVQLAATFQLAHHSIGQYRAEWLRSGGGVPLQALVSLVWPNYYGIFDVATYHQPYDLTFMYLYCGILGLGLALCGVFRPVRPFSLAFTLMLLLTGLGMLGDSTWLGRTILRLLPVGVKVGIQPEYTVPAFILSVAVLAALGMEAVIRPGKLRWIAMALCVLDLILVSSGRQMNAMSTITDPGISRTQFEGQTATLERVRNLTRQSFPPSRIDTINNTMQWAMAAPIMQIPSANGNDPLALSRSIQVRLAFTERERWGSYYEVGDLRSPVVGMLNVRYLVSRERLSGDRLAGSPFNLREEVPGFFVYENARVMPRFWLVGRIRAVQSMEEAARLLKSPEWKPAEEAIVEGGPAFHSEPGKPEGTVRVIRYDLSALELEIETPRQQYLASSETHYPGWHAWLDGAERELYYTNVAFRGMVIPPGRHWVTMRFMPSLLWWAGTISLAAWLVWIGLWWRTGRERKS